MAELIPLSYRLRIATRQRLTAWIIAGAAVVLLLGATLAYAFAWERQRTTECEALWIDHQGKSVLIAQSEALRAKREILAARMQKIQQLMDDRLLLALVRNISDGFSANDCLEYIQVDARGTTRTGTTDSTAGDAYSVRISGITTNSSTLAELMTRLTQRSNPPMNVVLQSSHRDTLLDGQVMRFQIVCEKPDTKGT
jgi:hypothetical protein